MLAVTAALPNSPGDRPPVVLIHGAANSAGVWTFWQRALAEAGWASYAIDLRGHGRSDSTGLSRARMRDYADDASSLVEQLSLRPVVMGWSMGGLVAMMVTGRAVVALAPSMPARAIDLAAPLREGEFGPEEYGITGADPDDQLAMPDLDREERQLALASLGRESRLARDERAAGVVVESMPCPLLIVTGAADTQWPRSRYEGLWLPADHLEVAGASHWGLVLSLRALAVAAPRVLDWLDRSGVG